MWIPRKNILLSGIWLHRPSQWVSLKENDVLYLIRPMTHSQHLAWSHEIECFGFLTIYKLSTLLNLRWLGDICLGVWSTNRSTQTSQAYLFVCSVGKVPWRSTRMRCGTQLQGEEGQRLSGQRNAHPRKGRQHPPQHLKA